MKCIAIVVMLALAAVNASVIPLGYPAPLPYAYGIAPQISLSQGLGPWLSSPLAYSAQHLVAAPGPVVAAPGPVLAQAQVVSAPAPVVVAAPAASYVAQTRGATHVAPLPGHIESVSSQNLQPAPGTL